MSDIPDIYDIIIIRKSNYEKHNAWHSSYCEHMHNNYYYACGTNDNKVYVNIIYAYMFSDMHRGGLFCSYDKTCFHAIVNIYNSMMYENIEKIEEMQKYLPLKIITLINESDIKVLKSFFNITKITTIELSDAEINLFLFTKRETLTKAAIRRS